MKKCMIALLIIIGLVFCAEPVGVQTFWNNNNMNPILRLIRTMPQVSTPFVVTGNIGTDTTSTSVSFSRGIIPLGIEISVSDTVESRGDSAVFKVLVGNTEVFSAMTSAFKLGSTTAPRSFYTAFTSLAYPSSGGAVSYRITQDDYAGKEGITEGTFKVRILYFYPND